ncbi:MAG: DUF3553 domain-containing protein [Pseudomonadota bacterium]
MNEFLTPGQLVTHPTKPEWGLGQVQSNVENKVTVNFENKGKIVFLGDEIILVMVD